MSDSINAKEFQLENYQFFRQDRNYRVNENTTYKRSGGLAMYVRDDISVDVNTLSKLNSNNINIEAQWVILKFDNIKDIKETSTI